MFRATLKSLLSRKLRLVLCGLAVIVGVMAVSGSLCVTATIQGGFTALFQTINADLDVQVTGVPTVKPAGNQAKSFVPPVPATLVHTVASVPGVDRALPNVDVDGARVVGPDGKVLVLRGPPRSGVSWSGLAGTEQLRAGRGPRAANEVAINGRLASMGDFRVGSQIRVITLQPARTFTVVGVYGFAGGRDTLGGDTQVAFTDPVAERLMLGNTGLLSSIDVRARPGVSPAALRRAIASAVGPGYQVRTGAQVAADQSAGTTQFLGVIQKVLLGFSGVALFVGIFLILNTFAILIAQRSQELALYRALGARRRQLLVSVLAEAVVIGLIASTIGLLAGFGLTVVMKRVMQSVSSVALPISGIVVPALTPLVCYLVGVVVVVVAAMIPAVRASRVAPVAAMRESEIDTRLSTPVTVVGAVLTAAGAVLIGIALTENGVALTHRLGRPLYLLMGGLLGVFVGVTMLTPIISRPAVWLIGRLFAWSTAGKLGEQNSARNPRRTSVTAAALMVGIALVTGVSVVTSSLTTSVVALTGNSLAADLTITGDASSSGRLPPTFTTTVIDRADELPGVRDAIGLRSDTAQLRSGTTPVEAGDLTAMRRVFRMQFIGKPPEKLAQGQVLVDQSLASKHKLAVGSPLMLATHRGGWDAFRVVGIYRQNRLLPGPVLGPTDGRERFAPTGYTEGFVTVAPGANIATVQRRIRRLVANNPEVDVLSDADYATQSASQINTFERILYILIGLALVIAILGVVNTLALSIIERSREVGLLRALGMRRSAVVGMITVESVVICLFGAALGVVMGTVIGVAAVHALHDQGIPDLSIPWLRLVTFFGIVSVAGVLAAIIPAVRAARTNMLRAIAHE